MESIFPLESLDLVEYGRISLFLMGGSLDLILRASLLLLGGIILTRLMRRHTAGVKHALWTTVFASLLLLPVVLLGGARWDLPVIPATSNGVVIYEELAVPEPVVLPDPYKVEYIESRPYLAKSDIVELPADRAIDFPNHPLFEVRPLTVMIYIWVLGFLGALLSIAVGKIRWFMLVYQAEPVLDPDWMDELERLRNQLGVRRYVRLLMSKKISTPMTGGVLNPVILVPDNALTWSPQRINMVLSHELVHIDRFDALRALLAKLALGVYWFHPLSWIASRMAATCMEEACDERVLNMGTKPSSYAQELLDMAERMTTEPSYAYLPMIRRSQLEQRLLSILNPDRPVKSATVSTLVICGVMLFGMTTVIANPVEREASPPVPVNTVIADQVVILDDNLAMSEIAGEPVIVITNGESSVGEYLDPIVLTRSNNAVVLLDTSEAFKKVDPAPVAALPSKRVTPIDPDDYTCEVPFGRGKEMKFDFHGSVNTLTDDEGSKYEYSGTYNDDDVVQVYREGVRLCMRAHGNISITADGTIKITRGDTEIGEEKWLLFEVEDDKLHKIVYRFGDGVMARSHTVNGIETDIDSHAEKWMNQLTEIFKKQQELGSLNRRGHSLNGNMANLKKAEHELLAQLAEYRAQSRDMNDEIAALRAQELMLQRSIEQTKSFNRGSELMLSAELQAEINELNERFRSEFGQVPNMDSVETKAYAEKYKRLVAEAQAKVEKELAAFNAGREDRMKEYQAEAEDVRKRLAEIQMAYDRLNADRRVEELKGKISAHELEEQAALLHQEVERRKLSEKSSELEADIKKRVKDLKRMMRRY